MFMRITGVLTFLAGVALIGFGLLFMFLTFSEGVPDEFEWLFPLIICLMVLSGGCLILFVLRTFYLHRSNNFVEASMTLDMTLVEDEPVKVLTATRAAGIIGMIAAIIVGGFTLFAVGSIVVRSLEYEGSLTWVGLEGWAALAGILLPSVATVLYVWRSIWARKIRNPFG